ncbi:hypothetical protein AWR36_005405 [Microbulbifer flavimaris]|uniref:DUF340 domain-containing protein n=1 Tax=Microbulbifer flavimaris TaxID=1781068 RepID=A0ABX4I0H6_9GAMM|nr:hypothetical protein AVO43_05395 [Microbulbifer sp. ZGT114]PCO05462.1 hypothetical protein AWR36_005405 [Microbulbifer flavimaris]
MIQGIITSLLVIGVGPHILREGITKAKLVSLFVLFTIAQYIIQIIHYDTENIKSMVIALSMGLLSTVGCILFTRIKWFLEEQSSQRKK